MNKIALLFSGQGSQYVGMGKVLYDKFNVAKEVFEEANDVLGFDLKKICFEGSSEELTKTEITQPAILTASIAAYRVLMQEKELKAEFMAGHSLGEYSALTAAGAMKFADAVKIVHLRGKFMQEAVPFGVGSMAVVSGINKEIIEETCRQHTTQEQMVTISNYNSPNQIVISGHKEAVELVHKILVEKGGRVIPLNVSAPFHCSLMKPAAEDLREELKKYTYGDIKCPVISNVTAKPYTGKDVIVENLSMQIVDAVRWQASMEYLEAQGVNLAIELGPQSVLKNLMQKNAPSIATFAFDKERDLMDLDVRLPKANRKISKSIFISRCLANSVCTQNHNWDNEAYQKGVVEPYKKLQQMQEELEKTDKIPTLEEMKQALDLLKEIFETKMVPAEERIERVHDILKDTGTEEDFKELVI